MGAAATGARERLQRQLEELEAVEAIFPEVVTVHGAARARRWLENGAAGPGPGLLVLEADLPVGQGAGGDRPVTLELVLSPAYPDAAAPTVGFVSAGPLTAADVGEALEGLSALAAESKGDECCMELLQRAEEIVEQHARDLARGRREREAEDEALDLALALSLEEAALGAAQEAPSVLGRRLCFSHHIIAPAKIRAIRQWAEELALGGFVKIGWPGLIVAEGREENVKRYVAALQRLRWQHFVVRGEEIVRAQNADQTVDDLRALPRRFEEIGERGMKVLAERMREAGLNELFRTFMK